MNEYNFNSKSKIFLFFVVATLIFATLIFACLGICSFFNINQILGVLFGLLVGICILCYVYDKWGNALLSTKEQYKIE